MKIVLSLNYRHFKITPSEFIELLKEYDKNNIIKGFEISIKYYSDRIYIEQLAKICKSEGYLLRLHAPTLMEPYKYEEYFDFANKIAQIYGNKINVVFHPTNAENIDKSILKTIDYLKHIYKYIELKKYDKVIISIENLNNINSLERLKKEDLEEILKKFKKLKFTYDIGHELIDDKLNTEMSDILLKRLNNLHIHIFNENKDHYPIIEKNEKSIKILEAIEKIKNNGYNGILVTEYAIDYIDGNSFISRLINYIKYSIMIGN